MSFTLDERLETDTLTITDLPLCRVLLMNNALFPWVVLVPRREGVSEITELSHPEQHQLLDEITQTSAALESLTGADKMNIAALGNIVRQLHVHVVARFESDSAWPNPVWGQGGESYDEAAALQLVERIKAVLV